MKNQIGVAKFGGTSVGTVASIYKCVDIVKNNQDIKVVVVSAQAGVTNLLEKLIKSDVYTYKKIFADLYCIVDPIVQSIMQTRNEKIASLFRELEKLCQELYLDNKSKFRLQSQILSFGERISAYIFDHALKQQGISSAHIDAREIIKADGSYIKARPLLKDIKSQAKKYFSDSRKLYVMGGFMGSNLDGETVVLGRGGSDYSAALVAEAVNADMLYIWTDVAGIHQADPRLIPKSQVIKQINFEEAIELIGFGAKVLHPDTLWPVMRSGTKVFVGSTFDPASGGTYITNDNEGIVTKGVRAIAERRGQSLIKVNLVSLDLSDIVYKVLAVLRKYDITPDVINLTDVELILVIDDTNNITYQSINNELIDLCEDEFEFEKNLSLTALVGDKLDTIPQFFNELLNGLGDLDVKYSGYSSRGKSWCLITADDAFEKVYKALF
ncbi:aspartate kinase [Francisella salina]|uniref:Aspartokinase n=1 Tax=Francisella salina TaxID=573569 RepID=A0ABM5M8C7_FRAST|nr:aspartate kinase [Francisella salina]AEI35455.1 Aspartokinase [Francisella salina]